jgi:DNA polymerase-3 subunit delta
MAKASRGAPRAYLLWGQEDIRKREALDELIAALVPEEDRDLDVEYVDITGAGVSGESILHAARDRAMFSERRVVVVLNAGRLRGPRHQRTQEILADGIPKLPDYSSLILVAYAEEADERRSRSPFGEKLMAALKAHGEVRQFAPLKPDELARLAVQEAAAQGKKLAPAAASMLAQRIGPDSHRLVQEVRKLAAYTGERGTISPEDVSVMVSAPPDDNIFRLLDLTFQGDRRGALEQLRQVRESDIAVPQVMVMLRRTLRQIAQAKYLAAQGVSPKAERDSVPPDTLAMLPEDNLYRGTKDWQRDRLWKQARALPWDRLHAAIDRLAVAEAGTKGWEHGIEDPDLALELMVVSLAPGR